MTRRASLNVSLAPELMAFIAAQVVSGRYGSASEIVRTTFAPAGGQGAPSAALDRRITGNGSR